MRRSPTSSPRLFALLAGVVALSPAAASATEPKKASEPRIMSEPGEITNVVDAFDDENGNPWDLHFTIGYQQSWQGAKIRRESFIDQPGLSSGRFISDTMNIATYKEVTSRLNLRADVGLYKDIGLYLRLPFILSNTRELTDLDGSEKAQKTVLAGSQGEQLFSLPFKSPTRSGIEYLAVGLDFGIFNQARDATKPTWVFGFEGRFNVSEPMHACGPGGTGLNQKNAQVACADPSDINRDGVAAGNTPKLNQDEQGRSLEGTFSGERKPGVSRGTTGLEIHSIMSRRVKYVEPYGGFRALIEFAKSNSDYGQVKGVDGILTAGPPLQGWMIVGIQFIPWEMREQFQRLTFDLRFTGAYRSEGRDYTPLFDAIGSSDAPTVRRPNFASFQGTGGNSLVNPNSQKIYVSGLTDAAAHGSFSLSGSAMYQAAEYVKFQVGVGYTKVQGHFITGDQPCNPNFTDDSSKSGPCQQITNGTRSGAVTGIPNPLYRPPLDIVGRRFKLDDSTQWDAWINAVVMF